MQSISLIRSAISIIVLYALADISFGYFLETKASLETLLQTLLALLTHASG